MEVDKRKAKTKLTKRTTTTTTTTTTSASTTTTTAAATMQMNKNNKMNDPKKNKKKDISNTRDEAKKETTASSWDISLLKLPRKTEIFLSFVWYLFLTFCVGLPIWYKTTTIYRAALPPRLTELENHTSPQLRATLSVVGLCQGDCSAFEALLKQSVAELKDSYGVQDVALTASNTVSAAEQAAFAGRSESAVDRALHAHNGESKPHAYTVYVIESTDPAKLKQRPIAGQWRHGWIYASSSSSSSKQSQKDLAKKIGTLAGVLLGHEAYAASTAAKSAPAYELTFTLLLDEDSTQQQQQEQQGATTALVSWDFAKIAVEYVAPLAARLAPLARVTTTSQILHFAGVGAHLRAQGGQHYIREEALPQLLDSPSGEWKIDSGSAVEASNAVDETLNLIMVVPAPAHSPLHVLPTQKTAGKKKTLDAYVRPRWGGAVIKNIAFNSKVNAAVRLGPADVKREMEVFVAQIRELMGISNVHVSDNSPVRVLYGGSGGATQWEVDAVVRRRAAENLRETRRALAAFGRVLADARYMRVVDRLAALAKKSVDALAEYERLVEAGNLDMAFNVSKEALVDAEEAFFDKDILALMYFPDEHKYAIYVPLFFPLGSQLVTSLFNEIKFQFERRRKRKNAAAADRNNNIKNNIKSNDKEEEGEEEEEKKK